MATVAQIRPNEEPPSGVQGKGTAEEPYDQGNAPEIVTTSEEPPSGIQGKGTAEEPYDQGNAPQNASTPARTAGTSSQPVTSTVDPASKKKEASAANGEKTTEERGRDALRAPAKSRIEERSVSPGTLDDGSHAQTSGERGEGYEPGKLSKLKSKLQFGKR